MRLNEANVAIISQNSLEEKLRDKHMPNTLQRNAQERYQPNLFPLVDRHPTEAAKEEKKARLSLNRFLFFLHNDVNPPHNTHTP